MGSGGLQWDAGDTLSSSRLNQKGLFIGTGAQIAALTPLTGMHAFCTSTGSGFTSGVEYRYNGSAWKAVSVQLDDSHQLNAQAEMRFADADSSNYVGFKAPDPVAANKIWVLPNADGSAGQVLKTDGSLNLGWVDAVTNPLNNNVVFQQKNSGATNRTLIYRDSSNNVQLGDATENGTVKVNEKLDFSNNVDSGLVNPVMLMYGRIHKNLVDPSYTTASGTGGTSTGGVGVVAMATGTVTNNSAWFGQNMSASGPNLSPFRRDRKFEIWYTVQLDTITSVELDMGLAGTISTTTSQTTGHHCAIQFRPATSANFIASNGNGTTQTATTSGTAFSATTIYHCCIVNNETNLKFYVNGSLIATNTTNLPGATTQLNPYIMLKTLNTTGKNLYVYYGEGWVDAV